MDYIDKKTAEVGLLPAPTLPARKPTLPPIRLALVAILVSFGSSFNFGFQLLITNPAQKAFLTFLNESKARQGIVVDDEKQLENEWSVIVATFFLGSLFGAFLIRLVSESLGRKYGLLASVSIQFISCILAILSYYKVDHIIFTISRLLMGLGITTSMGISAIFVTESSPIHCRGITSLINGVFLQFSLIVGAIMAMPEVLGTRDNWFGLYVLELFVITIVLLLIPLMHDSPGHLAARQRRIDTAESLAFYHSISSRSALAEADKLLDKPKRFQRQSLMSVWKDNFTRRGTLLGMLVAGAMAASGITVINAFAFEILLNTGMRTHEASIANALVCVFALVGILISARIIDHHGRRPLLITTFALLAIVNIIICGLMLAHKFTNSPYIGYSLVAAICAFNLVFAMGPGPLSLFISGELVPQSARSASSTWSNATMAITRFIVLSIYLPVKNAISEYFAYGLFFIAPMILVVCALFLKLPETKGKTPEEIRDIYESKN